MGAESSVLDECQFGETLVHGAWKIQHGLLRNECEISLFTCVKRDDKHTELLLKLIKNLKSYRHPTILKFIRSGEGSDGLYLVTEKVVPLEMVLEPMSSTEICAGLHNVMEALSFMHEKAGVSHNNLHLGSIYVTSDGSWKLSGLEHSCKISEISLSYLESCKLYRDEGAITPEEKEGKVSCDLEIGHTRDVYAFGVLTESLFKKMSHLDNLTKTFELRIQDECLNADPKVRPKLQSLLSDRLFRTEFLEIVHFLKHITLKSEEEKRTFFSNLLPKLLELPEDLLGKQLTGPLLSRFVILDQIARDCILPSLMTPCEDNKRPSSVNMTGPTPLLTRHIYTKYVVPKLVKIFTVHDLYIHVFMLKYFHCYASLIDKDTLEHKVFPQVLLGLRDSSDLIAAFSLHALAEMVLILGRDTVIGGNSKHFFKEELPKSQTGSPILVYNYNVSNIGATGTFLPKDLAKQSKTSPIKCSNDDDNTKWKESKTHPQGMKQKREERKLSRDKSKGAPESQRSDESSPAVDNNIIDQSNFNKSHQNTLNWSDGNKSMKVNNASTHSDWSKGTNDMSESEDEETADWSGFAENESINDDPSEEIENEIQNMVLQQENPLVNLTKMNIETTLLSSKSDCYNNKLKVPTVSRALKLSPNTASKDKTQKSGQENLGSEFDIMSLDIKVEKTPGDLFDFFADMAPKIEIKPAAVPLLTEVDPKIPCKQNISPHAKANTHAFNVIESTPMVETGVGDGWDNNDW